MESEALRSKAPGQPDAVAAPSQVQPAARRPLNALALDLPDAIALTRRYLDLALGVHLLVLASAVLTPSVYANPKGSQVFGLVSAVIILWARRVCVRGHPARGMMIYAIYEWLALAFVAALAGQPLMYAIPSIGFVPLLAMVVGVRAAALFAGSSFLFTVCAQLARSFDVGLPLLFPGTTAVMGLIAFIALITVLFPLPILVRVVNDALAAMTKSLAQSTQAQQRQQDFAEIGSDWFWETDTSHRFTAMWGGRDIDREALRKHWIGREPWAWAVNASPAQAQAWETVRTSMEAHLPCHNIELSRIGPDGQPGWLSVSGKPRFDADGTFLGYRGVSSRIDWRKKKEEELAEALDEARAAKHEADAANRAKSEFLATMSHEIRTPMNGIVGLTALALEGPLSADQREHLSAVQQSADGLLAIINDILDLSKIEAGQMQLEATPFDLNDVLSGVLKVVSFNARAKGVELSLDIAADVPRHLLGDPTRLRQVVLNLLGNAIKFTQQGSVVVRVRKQQHDMLGLMLHFEVQDSGIGIAADKRDAIFQPFTQADSSTTRRYGGTGLGLTICRRLVQLMGGEIGVDSTVGVGSTFHFTARLEVASQAQLEKRVEVLAPQRKLNILLVEDHPINQMLAVTLLERAGHRVSVAASGLDGVAQWRSISPDLILMDVQMPVMDGLEATRRIREAEAAEKLLRTPIIAMTANAFAEDRDACLAAGMDGYLSKPVKPEVLNEAIAQQVIQVRP